MAADYRWIQFGPDAVLISKEKKAHIPGACTHFTESDVLEPQNGWGWIADPAPGTWARITQSCPAKATAGNLARYAIERCQDCERRVPI